MPLITTHLIKILPGAVCVWYYLLDCLFKTQQSERAGLINCSHCAYGNKSNWPVSSLVSFRSSIKSSNLCRALWLPLLIVSTRRFIFNFDNFIAFDLCQQTRNLIALYLIKLDWYACMFLTESQCVGIFWFRKLISCFHCCHRSKV